MADENKINIGKDSTWTPDSVCSEPVEDVAVESENDPEAIEITDDVKDEKPEEETDDEAEETEDADESEEEEKKDKKPKEEKKEIDYKTEFENVKKELEALKATEEQRFKEFMNRNQQPTQPAANNQTPVNTIFDDPAKQAELDNLSYDKPHEFGKSIYLETINAVKEMLRPTLEMAQRFASEEKTQNAQKQIEAFKAQYAESGLKADVEKVLTDGSAEQKAVMELLQSKNYTLDEAFQKVFHKQIVEEEARKLAASRKGLSISTPQGRPVPQSEKDKPVKGIENIIRAVMRGKLK